MDAAVERTGMYSQRVPKVQVGLLLPSTVQGRIHKVNRRQAREGALGYKVNRRQAREGALGYKVNRRQAREGALGYKVNRRQARQGELRSKRRSPGGEDPWGTASPESLCRLT
jgi:hypothetical protein